MEHPDRHGDAGTRESPALSYSVVMPVYNAARTLESTIQAILRLNPAPRAIYVIDDASTDGSPEIARRHREMTTVVLESNGGAGGARNVGARLADTDLLLMIDSDCYIDPDGFRAAYDRLALDPLISGIMGVPGRDAPPGPFAGIFKNYWYHLEFDTWGNPPRTLYGSCFLMRRRAYLSVGGFDDLFGRKQCEDNEFYFRLVQAGHVFERRMDFTFLHDKTMTLRQLVRTSFVRSVSIIQNMRGKLGRRGNPWKPHEKVLWAMEIGGGTVAVASLPIAVGVVTSAAFGSNTGVDFPAAELFGGTWLLSVTAFFVCVRDKVMFSFRDKGLSFSVKLFVYRMLEMPVVALGIVWGSLSRADSTGEHKA